ncbi:hypothetical protein NE237_019125 [Protea cynaroides]|uniref:AB hydrolase-1 domain-containing protein n=1 Tax=Protea cynaroides TaxID=273540 RepID=A0A9Q0KBF0_9MAGN|nr:hypothetical protein NE237_019125 [Protea cynaroides]
MVHFILVHGVCHGGWCWYKVKPLLESAGHQVTAIDLAASGINMAKIDEIHTMADYTEPLIESMDSLPPGEKVILVGHSLAGISIALAMDRFPHKISAAVFLTAHMPDCTHPPSYVVDRLMEGIPADFWLDSKLSSGLDPVKPKPTVLFGPKCLASNVYQLCPPQDLALAEMLMRPGSTFQNDLSKMKAFSEVGYGSVNRVYIVCNKDLTMKQDFQRWLIENNPVKQVMEIEGADHMVMMSKPNEVKLLLESAGHRVTAVDLVASGINMAKIDEVHTMADYTEPLIELMDSLPPGEKVTLVGHSLGGFSLALAMDRFPHKISAAVFLTALMPDWTRPPSYVLDQRGGQVEHATLKEKCESADELEEVLVKQKWMAKMGKAHVQPVLGTEVSLCSCPLQKN